MYSSTKCRLLVYLVCYADLEYFEKVDNQILEGHGGGGGGIQGPCRNLPQLNRIKKE